MAANTDQEHLPGENAPRRHGADTMDPTHHTVVVGRARGRRPTPTQVAAVRAVMHLFWDDDIAAGLDRGLRFACDACSRSRPLIGSIRYGQRRFCNRCATRYELDRLSGLVSVPDEFTRLPRLPTPLAVAS